MCICCCFICVCVLSVFLWLGVAVFGGCACAASLVRLCLRTCVWPFGLYSRVCVCVCVCVARILLYVAHTGVRTHICLQACFRFVAAGSPTRAPRGVAIGNVLRGAQHRRHNFSICVVRLSLARSPPRVPQGMLNSIPVALVRSLLVVPPCSVTALRPKSSHQTWQCANISRNAQDRTTWWSKSFPTRACTPQTPQTIKRANHYHDRRSGVEHLGDTAMPSTFGIGNILRFTCFWWHVWWSGLRAR